MDAAVERERAPTTDRTRIPSAEIEYRSVSLRAQPYGRVPPDLRHQEHMRKVTDWDRA
jgi:uncharacterized protein YhdP